MNPSKALSASAQVAKCYFDLFRESEREAIAALFAPGAKVRPSSSAYAEVEPREFYQRVFELTLDKIITIHSVAIDDQNHDVVIVHFGYDWTLRDGTRKNFPHAFDRFDVDPALGKIRSLTINLGINVLEKI